ncbi:helix-hairpin-helix domain-containing protein [Saccharicrinis aurantiacus]|uniref:helix-hairpin-helix domain-containing protein n=1 Tax=Saccharicrinis aurantiacus TaxID=1849719 RepID=UPI00094F7983|nr:helix-hairpin-helix domain-containing protein [Saccharicrinis aurantiacus]
MFDKLLLYTRSQQRGIIVLVGLIIILLIVRGLLPSYFEFIYKKEVTEYERYFIALNDSLNDSLKEQRDRPLQLFSFDPNLISKEDLMKLGFNSYQTKNLLSYRKAGGSFKKTTDLKKIYGVDSTLYNKISPYVRIVQAPKVETKFIPNKKSKLNINKATYSDLVKVNDLGSKLASRIINFRKALGGFYDMKQIDEVYGINKQLCVAIKVEFYASQKDIRKIDLSEYNITMLAKHAYLNRKQAEKVLKLYEKYKDSGEISEFYKQLTGSGLGKIIPYIVAW